MGCEKITSSRETVGMGKLKWEGECDVSICNIGCHRFGNSWGERQETITVGREALALGKESACTFPGIQA